MVSTAACDIQRFDSSTPDGMARWAVQPNAIVGDGNSAADVEIAVRRATGDAWAGARLRVEADASWAALEQPAAANEAGVALGRVRCSQAGQVTLTAQVQERDVWRPLAGSGLLHCLTAEGGGAQTITQGASIKLLPIHEVGAADAGAPLMLTLVVTDTQGRPLANQTVTLSTLRDGDVVAPATAITNAQGEVQVTLTATSLGTATVVARMGATETSTTVPFVAAAPNLATSAFVARSGPAIADGQDSQVFDLILRDGAGHGVPYASVTLTSDQPQDVLQPQIALTDALGHLSVALTGTRQGSRQVTATTHVGILTAAGTLVAGPPSAAASTLWLDPSSATADGQEAVHGRVTLRDAQGNPESNQTVAFALAAPALGVLTPASGVTDGAGKIDVVLTSTQAGDKILTASVGAVTLSGTATFVAGAPSAATSTLTSAPSTIIADGQSPSTLLATLKDIFGNPTPHVPVSWEFVGTGGSVAAMTSAANGAGVATASVTGTFAGTGNVLLHVGAVTFTQTITFVPGPPSAARSVLTLSPNVQVADGSPIAVNMLLVDAQDNPVPDVPVAFSTNGGHLSVAPGQSVTDGSGRASNVWTSTAAGLATLWAQAGNISLLGNATFVAGTPVASQSSLSVSAGAPVANGSSPLLVTVSLRDAYANPTPAAPVALTSSIGGDTVTPASGVTASSGLWSTNLTGTWAGTRTLTARSGAVTLTTLASLAPGAPSSTSSALTVSPNALIADGQGTAIVRWLLRDSFGNPTPFVPVAFSSGDTGITLTAATATSDATGHAQVTVQSTVTGIKTIHGEAGAAVAAGNVTVTFLPGPPSTAQSTWTAGAPQVADGVAPAALQLALRDALGNPTPGVALSLSLNGPGTLGATVGVTDVDGLFATTLVSTQAGSEQISITTGQGALMTTATFVAGPPSDATSTFYISPDQLAADGSTASLDVYAADAFGNAIGNLGLTFVSSDSNDTLTASGTTDSQGLFSGSYSSVVQATKAVTATLGESLALSANVDVRATHAVGGTVTLTASPNVLVADGLSPSVITVLAQDTYGNPLNGHTVTLSANPNTPTFGTTALTLDGTGQASTTLSTTTVGPFTLLATIDGVTKSSPMRATAGSPNATLSQLTVAPAQTVADGTSQAMATVLLKDDLGHPIPAAAVALAGDGQVILTATNLTTDSSGQATAPLTSAVAGTHALSATSASVTLLSAATFVAGAADAGASSLVISPNQTVADGVASLTAAVAVADARGNPVVGQTVTFSASDSHVLGLPTTGTTDGSGHCQLNVQSTWAGGFTFTAAVQQLNLTAPATFVAGSPNQSLSTLALSPNTAAADGTSIVQASATLRDDFGNLAGDVPVTWSCVAPGVSLGSPSASTDHSGVTTTTVTSTGAGTAMLRAQSATVTLSAPVVFVAGNPNASTSTFVIAPGQVVADGLSTAALTLVARDAYGNLLPSQTVTPSTPVTNIVLLGPAATDGNGVWVGTAQSTVAQTQSLVVTLGPVTLSGPVQFVAGPPSAATSAVTPSAPSTVADGQSSVTLTVRVADAANNPVLNQNVALTIGGSSNTPGPLSGTTDSAGQWRTQLTSTRAELKALTAEANGVAILGNVLFVAGVPSSSTSTVVASPNSLVANGSAQTTVTVLAQDAFNNPVVAQSVSLASLPAGYVLGASAGTTDASGAWATTLTATRAGSPNLTAVLGSASVTGTVTFVAGPPVAGNATLVLSPNVLTIDGSTSATATFADAYANPVMGQSVAFSVPGPYAATPPSATTNGSGKALSQVSGTLAGTTTVTASIGGVSVNAPLTFLPGAPSAANSSLAVSPNTTVADNNALVTLTATFSDAFNNPIANGSVAWSGALAQDSLAVPTSNTNSSGVAANTLRSTLAHTLTATAQLGNVVLSAPVTFVAGAPNQATSSVILSPNTLTADGAAKANITAIVNDVFGNPVPARTVTFTSSGARNTLTPTTVSTSGIGTAAATLASTKAELKTVTASVAGISLSDNVTFTAGSPNFAMSSLSIAPTTCAADGIQTVTAAAQINDAYGNPISGLTGSASVSGIDTAVAPSPGSTSAAGSFVSLITTTTIQNQNVTLTAGPYSLTSNVNFTLGPPRAATSSFTASPNSGLPSNSNAVSTLTITLRDNQARLLPNLPFTLMSSVPGRTMTPITTSTDGFGTAYATVRSSLGGSSTIRAITGGDVLSTSVSFLTGSRLCTNDVMLPQAPGLYTSFYPTRIYQADVNADGIVDIIASGFNNIAVGLGVGDGSFSKSLPGWPPSSLGSSASYGNADALVVADLDGDTRLDIAAATNNNTVILLHGNGAGSFSATKTLPAFGPTVDLCSADFNNDGLKDLAVVANANSVTNLTILMATGGGNFVLQSAYAITGTPIHCIAADINKDNKPDLLIMTATAVQELLGLGNGTFAPATTITNQYLRDWALGDINKDGNFDLVMAAASLSQSLMTALGQGDGTFSAIQSFSTPSSINFNSLSLYDADHDGFLDACAITGGNFTIFHNDSTGKFTTSSASISIWDEGSLALVGDYNGDGNTDFIYTMNQGWNVVPMMNRGNFQYDSFGRLNRNYSFLAKADINNDGRSDLLGISGGNTSATFSTITNNGDGSFTERDITTPAGVGAIAAEDLNGDGNVDVIVSYTSLRTNQIYLGSGNGNFTPGSSFAASIAAAGMTNTLMFKDLNNDGAADLVGISANTNALLFFLNSGNGNFSLFSSLATPTALQSFALADVNSDGLLDVIAGLSLSNQITVYTGFGDGTFSPNPSVTLSQGPYINVGDFNLDGVIDIAGNPGGLGKNYVIYLGLGNGQFTSSRTVGITSLYYDSTAPTVADLDGDGIADIIGLGTRIGISMARGKGDGTFLSPKLYPAGQAAGAVVGDFNSDGRQDIFFYGGTGSSRVAFSSGCH